MPINVDTGADASYTQLALPALEDEVKVRASAQIAESEDLNQLPPFVGFPVEELGCHRWVGNGHDLAYFDEVFQCSRG